MFIDKDRRYFRRYTLHFKPRHKHAPGLPIVAKDGEPSILNALHRSIASGKASAPQPSGDTVELIKAIHDSDKSIIVLLFHRSSPNAADPAYRKRNKEGVSVRLTVKERDEEQAISSHLIVRLNKVADQKYEAALEEVSGLSASAVLNVFARSLADYPYSYVHKKKDYETYIVLKATGLKSQSLDEAVKNQGALRFLTLTREMPVDAPDASGLAVPQKEVVRYKMTGDPSAKGWAAKFNDFVNGAKTGWDKVTVDIKLDDERQRTIRVDQEADAAEFLFVRSELVHFGKNVDPCSMEIVPEIVQGAQSLFE